MATTYVLGVDAGGTKTHALVSDLEGHILGAGKAGPGNFETSGLHAAKREIFKAVKGALGNAKVKKESILHAFYGLAGADIPPDFIILRNMVHSLQFSRRFSIRNDSFVALRSGLTKSYGVVVVSGTGTVVAGRDHRGKEYRVGGLGYEFGDWGSGSDIARETVAAVLHAHDGRGMKTKLTRAFLNHFMCETVQDFLSSFYRKVSPQHAPSIVRLTFQCASQGDPVARDILHRAGRELGKAACAAIRRLKLQKMGFEVALAGGVFQQRKSLLVTVLRQTVRSAAPKARIVFPGFLPVAGAVMLALECLNIDTTRRVYANLKRTYPKHLRVLKAGSI